MNQLNLIGLAIAAMAMTSAVSAAGTCGQTLDFDFSGIPPLPFGGEYLGIFTSEGTVVGATVDVEFTTAGNFNAADLGLSFELIDATHGVGFGFTGASVGWSGQGTFTLQVPTSNFNGLLNNAGNPWGGMLFVFSNNNPGNGPIQGTLTRAIYKREFGPCPIGDLTGDLSVNVEDLLAVIAAWGPCPAEPTPCPADIVDDQTVNVADLLAVISHWHTWCPNCK